MVLNNKFILDSYRQGGQTLAQALKYESEEIDVVNIAEGSVAVRVVILSLDPTYSIWATDIPQYLPVIKLGSLFRGLTIGRVITSKDEKFPVGSWVTGVAGWQEYYVGPAAAAQLSHIPFDGTTELNLFFGLIGMVGLTAYFGLLDVLQPEEGQTLVVSGAAGAVGSIVGQIAKLKGLRVIGIAGGKEKCALIKAKYGYDEAIDYKNDDIDAKLKEFAPKGVDLYFDNVGGDISETVVMNMNTFGRISLCGQISGYKDGSMTFKKFDQIIGRRLTIRGFVVFDFLKKYAEGVADLYEWYKEGKLSYAVDERRAPLSDAADICEVLFTGENTGKLMVRLCENEEAKL